MKTLNKDPDLAILSSGYYVESDNVIFWAKVQNQSESKTIEFPTITCTVKDSNGTILGTQDQVGSSILPGDISELYSQIECSTSQLANVEITAKKPDYESSGEKAVATKDFTIEGVSEVDNGLGSTKVTGTVTYKGEDALDMIALTAVYKSGDTEVYASQDYLDDVQPNQATPFEIDSYSTSELPAHDSVEVIAEYWG